MVTLATDVSREDGVTLVEARVGGCAVPTRVRLVSRLDGPVWPPRRRGVPERGWDGDAVERTVPAEGTLVVGFASPAEPVDPPVEIETTTPLTDGGTGGPEPTVRSVRRELRDPRPPRDAVPAPGDGDETGDGIADGAAEAGVDSAASDTTEGSVHSTDAEQTVGAGSVVTTEDRDDPFSWSDPGGGSVPEPDRAAPDDAESEGRDPEAVGPDGSDAGPRADPAALATRLRTAERRIESAERLGDATTLPAATEALAAVGGLAGARRLATDLDRDADRLAALADRAARLAERAEDAEVPLSTLEAIA